MMNHPTPNLGQKLQQCRPYLYLLARTLLSRQFLNKFDASDLVQQTLLDAFAKRDQFRGSSEDELVGWLRQILKNNLAEFFRNQGRAKRDIRRERSLEEAIDASYCQTDQWLAAVQSSPSKQVIRQEDLLRLSAALTELPEAQREAVVLHHLQGLKLAEVAAEIGRSEAAVAGLLFRGLKALQKLLEG